jgi:hypothetical protein
VVNSETGATFHIPDNINQVIIVGNNDFAKLHGLSNLSSSWTQVESEFFLNTVYGGGNLLDLNSDLGLLSRILFAEMRGENNVEMEVVANVVSNRVSSSKFPDSFEGVITQRSQFSSLFKTAPNKKYYDNPLGQNGNVLNQSAWLRVLSAAAKVHYGINNDITSNSLLYYSPRSMIPTGSSPKWNFNKLNEITISGVRSNHLRLYQNK